MESAIQTLVSVYVKASKGKDGLGRKDFNKLVKTQFGNIMADTNNSSAVNEMRQGLDEDSDGKVSFAEYLNLIGSLANSMSQVSSEANPAAS